VAELDLAERFRVAICVLDAEAPEPDRSRLATSGPYRRRSGRVLAVAAAVGLAVIAAPAAFSAFDDLLRVEPVEELPAAEPDVAPAFLGRAASLEEARWVVPFPLRELPALGEPSVAYVRDDVPAGMATVAYTGTLLTQWPADAVDVRVAVVPTRSVAEELQLDDGRPAQWISGEALGTFALVGADGAVHRERFEVAAGSLLWQEGRAAFLLQGAGSAERALRLAAEARAAR
jgi:hypothetical protein